MKNYLKLLLYTFIVVCGSHNLVAQGNKYKHNGRDYQEGKNFRLDDDNRNATFGGWERIGSKTVQKITETDEFRPSSRKSYSQLKIGVKESTVTINRITIFYEGGRTQDVEIRKNIKPGQETRTINLISKRSRIVKIRFLYKTKSILGSRAVVEIWAKRS